jgi:hypothetical protein
MRHANISMALVAAVVLALMGCEIDRAETPTVGAGIGAAPISTATVKTKTSGCLGSFNQGDYNSALKW